MATSLTVQNSISFATPILKNQPLLVSNLEPAMTAANMVLGMMLGAPCRWKFNRVSTSFAVTKANGTDYSRALSDFGFLDVQWLKDANNVVLPLEGSNGLPIDSSSQRPTKIAAQFDDNAGNITFRLDHTPDANYTVYLDYQKKAALLTSPASPWGPVSDEFMHIYNWGFLCICSLLINDSRFPIFEQYFISRLLGAQDGMSDQERNIFVGNWMALLGTLQRTQGSINSGIAGRAK